MTNTNDIIDVAAIHAEIKAKNNAMTIRQRVEKEVHIYTKEFMVYGMTAQIPSISESVDWDAIDRADVVLKDEPRLRDVFVIGAIRDMDDYCRASLGWDA